MDYTQMTCQQGVRSIQSAMSRLTLLRHMLHTPVMEGLRTLLSLLEEGELSRLEDAYHALTAELLRCSCRRISGDLFSDFLLHQLLEEENDFSLAAANGDWQEPLSAAMRYDLVQLSRIYGLNSVTIKRWAGERAKELKPRPRQNKDNISALSSAVWGGNTSRPLPTTTSEPPAAPAPTQVQLNESDWLSWRYSMDGFPAGYVADEGFEALIHRLGQTEDWGLLLDDLWSFHNTYGAGNIFLSHRVFRLQGDGSLCGIESETLPSEDEITFFPKERELVQRNVIRFMQGEPARNMLITGAAGMGKTTQMLSLVKDLPQVRLLLCSGCDPKALQAALEKLTRQPFRLIVFLDDLALDTPAFEQCKQVLSTLYGREDVLLIGAARTGEDPFFPLHVPLYDPQLKTFMDVVQALLLRDGLEPGFNAIQNACIDQAAIGKPLSFPAAYAVVDALSLQ